ncbi:hypothetical protein A2G06_16420 (plasmid) [Geobacter anodireducens]|nr:hypothetical protein A2G06_16420 [Geobacter anodireducens]
MLQRIREQIRVGVVFGPGPSIHPIWFDWRREKRTIEKVTYRWRHMAGNALLLHFAVTDGTSLYELIYNAKDQLWTLEAVDGDVL